MAMHMTSLSDPNHGKLTGARTFDTRGSGLDTAIEIFCTAWVP